jgi:hypothetical protein
MSGSKVHPITDDERHAFSVFTAENPRLSSQLPAVLPCGFKLTTFHAICSSCDKNVPMYSSWLKKDRQEFGSIVVEIWDIRAYCSDCLSLTPCYLRYRSDGTFDTLVGHSWRHGVLGDKNNSVYSPMTRLVRCSSPYKVASGQSLIAGCLPDFLHYPKIQSARSHCCLINKERHGCIFAKKYSFKFFKA